MSDKSNNNKSEKDKLLDKLIRAAREERAKGFVRPKGETITAYLMGTASEKQKKEVRNALLKSAAFRREILKMAKDMDAVANLDFAQFEKEAQEIPIPEKIQAVIRGTEPIPFGQRLREFWGRLMELRIPQRYAPAAVAVAVLVLVLIRPTVTKWSLVEQDMTPPKLVLQTDRSAASIELEKAHSDAEDVALASIRLLLDYDWKVKQFQLLTPEKRPEIPPASRSVILRLVDDSDNLLAEFREYVPISSKEVTAWALELPAKNLYKSKMKKDITDIEWTEEMGSHGCITFTYREEEGYKAVMGFTFDFRSSSSDSVDSEAWKELLDQAESLCQSNDFDSAIVSAKKALALAERQFGNDDTRVALILHRLGVYFYKEASYAEAESSFRRSLSIRLNAPLFNHIDVCENLTNLSEALRRQSKYTAAEPFGEKALLIAEKSLPREHPLWSTILFNHANLQQDRGKYNQALGLFNRALKALSESGHPRAGRILRNLANLYCDCGKFSEAESLYKRALTTLVKTLGPKHVDVVATLNDFALYYRDQGRYAEAEPLYLKGQVIMEEHDPEHIYVGVFLNNRAELYCDWGKLSEAEPLYERACTILVKSLGPDHPNVAENLNSLAFLYKAEGKYAKAEKLFRRALSIYEKDPDANHLYLAKTMNNLASLYCEAGRYAEAESLCQQALETVAKGPVPKHPEAARSMMVMADLCGRRHKYQRQESLYRRALATFKDIDPGHPELAGVLEKLSQCHRLQDRGQASLSASQDAFEIRLNNFRDNVWVLSEKDALTYSQFMRNSTDNYLSCFIDGNMKDAVCVKRAGQIVFASKGQVSDEIFWRRRLLKLETDSTILALADSLRRTQSQLSDLFVSGPGEDMIDTYSHTLNSLSRRKQRLESDLGRKSASFKKRQEYRNLSVERISSLTPEKSVIVEFLKYDYLQLENEKSTSRYLAVVLDSKGSAVITDLGPATAIDSLVSDYRKHMLKVSSLEHLPAEQHKEEYERIARSLYDALIRPIQGYMQDKNLVLVAPDAGLNLISFAGLIDEQGEYLVESFPIHYLSSGRDLIRLKDRKTTGQGLLAMGDPNYDATVEARLGAPVASTYAETGDQDKSYTRNVRSGCGDLSQLRVKPLRYTQNEIKLVTERWSGLGADSAVTFLGSRASEDNFKAQAPGKKAIHLSTHGYFYEGHCKPDVQHSGSELSRKFIGENPLLLSGLLFAGSNLHGAGADSAGLADGVLSAYEVSAMDLEGTDLVVLSACETGLGEVKEGEGVYGLRRAFQMAGARTVVSALWPVSDEITAEMMGQLYSQSKKLLPQRIRETQLNQIQKLRSHGFPDHPYNWAAFIATGDWR